MSVLTTGEEDNDCNSEINADVGPVFSATLDLDDVVLDETGDNKSVLSEGSRTNSVLSSEEQVTHFVADDHNDVVIPACVKATYRVRLILDTWLFACALGQAVFAIVQLAKTAGVGVNEDDAEDSTSSQPFGSGADYPTSFCSFLLVVSLVIIGTQAVFGTALAALLLAVNGNRMLRKPLPLRPCYAFQVWAANHQTARLVSQIGFLLAIFAAVLYQLHSFLDFTYPLAMDLQLQAFVRTFRSNDDGVIALLSIVWIVDIAGLICVLLFCFIWMELRRPLDRSKILLQEQFALRPLYDSGIPVSARLSRILDLNDQEMLNATIRKELLTAADEKKCDDNEASTEVAPANGTNLNGVKRGLRRRRSMSESVDTIVKQRSADVLIRTKHFCSTCRRQKAACVYLPCRHFIHCRDCSLAAQSQCPGCNVDIDEVVEIFQ